MKNNIQLLIGAFIGILFFLSSCAKKEEVQVPVINLDQAKEMPVKDFFSKVEVIALADNGDKFISNVNSMLVAGDNYIVSDSKDIIYVYSKKGKLLADSQNRIGRGPNEYSIITAHTYNPFTKNLEIVTPKHLMFYDLHFNLVKKIELPTKMSNNGKNILFFGHIYDLSNSLHVLIPTPVSEDKNTLFLFDSSSSKIIKKIDLSEDFVAGINMQDYCFFDFGKQALGFVRITGKSVWIS